MSHYRYARVILDIPHKGIASPRDDEVDVLVELEEGGDFGAGLYGLDVCLRERCFGESGLDRLGEEGGGVCGLFASFKNGGVACRSIRRSVGQSVHSRDEIGIDSGWLCERTRFDSQRGNVHYDLGSSLEYHEKNANRT